MSNFEDESIPSNRKVRRNPLPKGDYRRTLLDIPDQDIDIVARESGCNQEEAKEMIKICDGDIVNAIIELSS